MRDYQPQKNNPYWLERSLYVRTLSLIRDYNRMKSECADIPEQGKSLSDLDGMPHGTNISDETFHKVNQMSRYWEDMKAVEQSLNLIPEEYQNGVWYNITEHIRYPDDADKRTYATYKQRFIFHVAYNKGWV